MIVPEPKQQRAINESKELHNHNSTAQTGNNISNLQAFIQLPLGENLHNIESSLQEMAKTNIRPTRV
jgi:hypothetical protein